MKDGIKIYIDDDNVLRMQVTGHTEVMQIMGMLEYARFLFQQAITGNKAAFELVEAVKRV